MSLKLHLRDPNDGRDAVYESNYTHNVAPMWKLVGVYETLYESDGKRAEQLLPALAVGINVMLFRFSECEKLNPSNGWGDAYGAVDFLYSFAKACARYPQAIVTCSK